MLLKELIKVSDPPFVVQCDGGGPGLEKRLKLLGVFACIVDISKSSAAHDLFEKFRVALQMPSGKITNWDALDEALADLSWLRANSINIVLVGAANFSRRDPQSFQELMGLLQSVGEEWSKPITDGEWWDRNAIPFHVFIELDASERLPINVPALSD